MCVYRRYITNPYTGHWLTVSCGRCPACQQSKAIQRTNRIRNNYDEINKNMMVLFCTFTYRNSCVPYFNQFDFNDTGIFEVKRDSKVRYVRIPGKRYGRKSFKKTELLCELDPEVFPKDVKFKSLRSFSQSSAVNIERVGVVYNPDFANFIKRLSINLKRKYHYDKPLSYFYCSEYGPTTQRPHFHALFFIPFGYYQVFKNAISSSWSFDDYRQCRRNIQIARNAASYVSSYVNKSGDLPDIFSKFKETRQAHHYSQGFGFGKEAFSLASVVECFNRRDMHVDVPRFRDKAVVVDRVLLPKYVINKYFPKFKGYCRLTSYEIAAIYERPEFLLEYEQKCSLEPEDTRKIVTFLLHKRAYAADQGLSPGDFAWIGSQIHIIYSSNVLRDFYELQVEPNILEAYDNIKDVDKFSQPYLADYLDELSDHYSNMPLYGLNEFPSIIAKTNKLTDLYNSYSKDRKVRNHIYSQKIFV